MKKTPLAMLAAWFVLAACPLGALSPNTAAYFSFLDDSDRRTLIAAGELTASGSQVSQLPYGYQSPLAPVIAAGLTLPGAVVAQEGWYLFPRPAGEAELKVYNTLNSVASMEGIQYYSLSQKKMETLILASWRVDSVEKASRVPDPTFTKVPSYQRAVVFQKDNRLGDGYSELIYQNVPGRLTLRMKNLSELKYLFVPLVAPGNLQMIFIVVPLADNIAVYAAMEVKTSSLFGLERSKDENFRNRMRALAGWLGQRISSLK